MGVYEAALVCPPALEALRGSNWDEAEERVEEDRLFPESLEVPLISCPYWARVRRRIHRELARMRDPTLALSREQTVVVRLEIERSGVLVALAVLTRSAPLPLVEAVRSAILRCAPFPPVPAEGAQPVPRIVILPVRFRPVAQGGPSARGVLPETTGSGSRA